MSINLLILITFLPWNEGMCGYEDTGPPGFSGLSVNSINLRDYYNPNRTFLHRGPKIYEYKVILLIRV